MVLSPIYCLWDKKKSNIGGGEAGFNFSFLNHINCYWICYSIYFYLYILNLLMSDCQTLAHSLHLLTLFHRGKTTYQKLGIHHKHWKLEKRHARNCLYSSQSMKIGQRHARNCVFIKIIENWKTKHVRNCLYLSQSMKSVPALSHCFQEVLFYIDSYRPPHYVIWDMFLLLVWYCISTASIKA